MERVFGADLARNRQRTSIKWRGYPPDVLPLWVAEMDARPCPPVAEVVAAMMQAGDAGYGRVGRYAEVFADFASRRYGWQLDPSACVGAADVMNGAIETIRLVTSPGGTVIISDPVYDSFPGFVAAYDRVVARAPLTETGRLDLSALDRAFGQATANGAGAAFLLCNPQNPTGTRHTLQELAAVAELSRLHGVRVISDEIHGPLTYDAAYVPYLSLPGTENDFAVYSPSKAWNLAGLKSALIIPGSHAEATLRALPPVVAYGASHLGIAAHTAALEHGEAWLDQALVELDENRRLLAQLLAAKLPDVGYRIPEATYLAWLDFRGMGLGDNPAEPLLTHARVALSQGPNYGPSGAGFARLNFATNPAILTEAIERIAAVL